MRLSNGDVLFDWPLKKHVINQGWKYSDGSQHNGIDLKAAVATPVYAAEDGYVSTVQYWDRKTKDVRSMKSYGNMVDITHNQYKNKSLKTRYAHLNTILVTTRESVKAGQIIGYSGSTGNVTGPHLHFEVLWGDTRTNPLYWLDDDFVKANSNVKLGTYISVERPKVAKTQRVFLIGLNCNDKNLCDEYAKEMNVSVEYHCNNKIAIYPILSDGDAYRIMQGCIQSMSAKYYSEYN